MIINRITLVLSLTFFLLFSHQVISQERRYSLIIDFPENTANSDWIGEIIKSHYRDSTEVIRALDAFRDRYYRKGYLAAGFHSLEVGDSVIRVTFYSGYSYHWGRVSLPRTYPPGFPKVPRSIKVKTGKSISIEESENIRDAFVEMYENNGYPFASVRYDSIKIKDSIVEAKVLVEPGQVVFIDSIVNRSEKVVSEKVLKQIIGIKTGQLYSEKKIIRAGKQLNNSEIIRMTRPLEVGFTDDKAWIYISPKRKMANSFDGVIGLVPGAANRAGLALTGSLDVRLSNLLRQAEALNIRWKAPGNQNQQLKAGFEIPYLLGWPIGITSSLDLLRKDSSYLSTDWTFGFQVAFRLQNRVGFYIRQKASNILLQTPNPLLSDVGVKMYGLNWNWQQLENPLNPRKGFMISTDLGVGSKRLGRSESADGTSVYWEGRSDADCFIPLGKFLVLNIGGQGGYLQGGQVYDNERFRTGGIYSLRGFDEESILADSFVLGTLELRYLFSRNSNFHLFMDGGRWWSKISDLSRKGTPIGFGAGVALETRAGILLLDYALGVSEDIPLSIRNGKIHLGIKSLF